VGFVSDGKRLISPEDAKEFGKTVVGASKVKAAIQGVREAMPAKRRRGVVGEQRSLLESRQASLVSALKEYNNPS